MELRAVTNMTKRYMDSHSHKKMIDSITGTNGWILGRIAHSGDEAVFQRDLEDTFGITRSTVSKVVNLMVQKGLIERSPVEYDARLKRLTLTDKSRELLGYMQSDNEMMDAILTEGFSDEEKEKLNEYVRRMKKNLKNKFEAAGEDPHGCFEERKED